MKSLILPVVLSTIILWQYLPVDAAVESNITTTETCNASSIIAPAWWESTMSNCATSSNNTSTQNASVSQNNSSSGEIANEISSINESITSSVSFDSAPISSNLPLENIYNVFTSWEIMHRTPLLAGFMWVGEVANFITPAMYIGTPFADSRSYMWAGNPSSSDISDDPTTYTECIQHQSYLSFGLGERIKDSDIEELKIIAKSCAQEFYGSYFEGKEYTTREEFLMMMFAMFEEPVSLQWEFTEEGKFVPNSDATSDIWYTPFVSLAQDLALFPSENTEAWKSAQEITNTEIIQAVSLYTAHRMEYTGDTLDRGIITTHDMNYNLAFPDDEGLVIRIQ